MKGFPFLLCLFFSALPLIQCQPDTDGIFLTLRATLSKDHPSDSSSMSRCVEKGDTDCIRLARRTISACDKLLSMGPEAALNGTITSIFSACPKTDAKSKDICHGAITALYLFSTPGQDSLLQSLLGKGSRDLLRSTFLHFEHCWQYNRPNPGEWLAFMKDGRFLSESERTGLGNNFLNKAESRVCYLDILRFRDMVESPSH